ncbi:MAG: hypothetical protein M3O25_01380 [Actinomycetota bacterium]|nr:hypothetical protein [Actinomycetota bacterium]
MTGTTTTRAIAALAVLAAVLAAGIPAQADSVPGSGEASYGRVGKRALVVGDSLAVGTRPYLVRSLRGWRVGHSVSISKHAPQGAGELARRGARGLPPVVVASLGTNDDPGAVSSFDHSVRVALRAVGKRGCVVWPNIVRPSVGGRTYAGYNGVLRRLEAKRRNLIVFNWARMAGRNRGWFGGDGVHPNATGYAARGRAIANAVRECRGRLVKDGDRREELK